MLWTEYTCAFLCMWHQKIRIFLFRKEFSMCVDMHNEKGEYYQTWKHVSCPYIPDVTKCDVTSKLRDTMFNQASFALMCTMKKVHQMPWEAKSVKTWAIPLSQKLPSAMSTVGTTDPLLFCTTHKWAIWIILRHDYYWLCHFTTLAQTQSLSEMSMLFTLWSNG